MSVMRLYAAPLMLLVWAVLVAFIGNSMTVIVIRPLTVALALALSIWELSRTGRRRGR